MLMAKAIQFTREGYEKLKAELDELRGPARANIADAIREAKSHGDLRENAAYHEAKLNQSRLDGRIADLEKALQNAQIVERPAEAGETAHLGSKVMLKDLEYEDEIEVTIVGGFEADPSQSMISMSSPLGEALLGRSVGDKIEVEAPAGVQEYEILAISR
ncbi:transcription elongation factor GreA [bacterium]|nr:MAG: transcription elongation factor GreA [bacterium]